MILYFSGTGNSKYVAEYLGRELSDTCLNLFDRIRKEDYSKLHSETPWVIVTPIYAYKIPPMVENFLLQTLLEGSRQLYFLITCGSGICGAGYFNKKLAECKDMEYMGTAKIVMPENYIAMFKAPEKQKALAIVNKAEPSILAAVNTIKTGGKLNSKSDGKIASVGSSIVHKVFFGGFVKDTKFTVSDACNGCGKCERNCVKGNIAIIDGKPAWRGHCTHCMACICGCPKKAIEYGRGTKNKVRYKCPK